MLDTRQLLQEASAAGDQQPVVRVGAAVCHYDTAVVAQSGDGRSNVLDPVLTEEAIEREDQVMCLAQPGRDPDQARVVEQLGPGADQCDPCSGVLFAQAPRGGETGEAGANDGDGIHSWWMIIYALL